VRQTWSAAAAGPYTVSFWARGTSAGGQGVAWVYQGGVRGSLYFTYTTTWTRFAYVATITAPSSPLVIYGGNGDFGLSLASAADYLLWGVQVEAGGAPVTSYVATTSAPATRTAETLLATTPAGLSRTEGCAAVTVTAPWTGAAPRDAELLDTSAANTRFLYAASGSTSVSASDGTHTPAVAAGFSAGIARRYRVTWSSGGNALQLSNVTTSTTGTATAFTTWPAFGSALSLGGASGALVGGVTLSSVILGAAAGACP
jgi:hypothetical protein